MPFRRLLVATALLCLAAGLPGPSAAQLEVTIEPAPVQPVQPSQSTRTLQSDPELAALQVRSVVYYRLMAEILRSGIREQIAQGGSAVGEVNPYPSVTASKALAACVNWRQTTLERVTWGGFAYRYGAAVAPGELEDLTRRALEDCTAAYLGRDCVCQVVDVNGENALEVPADFLAEYGRF